MRSNEFALFDRNLTQKNGLPLNESDAFAAQIAALTLDQVNAIARKYARNDQSFFVLIGNRAKIEPQLKNSK